MPNRLSDEKAQLIASTYLTNGLEKVKALLSVGYSKTYANNVGLKLFDNDKVKLAIKRIQNVQIAKTGFTVDEAQQMYLEDRAFARKCRQAGAATSATTGICRLYGMDKDSGGGREQTIIIIGPKQAVKAIESQPVASKGLIEGEPCP